MTASKELECTALECNERTIILFIFLHISELFTALASVINCPRSVVVVRTFGLLIRAINSLNLITSTLSRAKYFGTMVVPCVILYE